MTDQETKLTEELKRKEEQLAQMYAMIQEKENTIKEQ